MSAAACAQQGDGSKRGGTTRSFIVAIDGPAGVGKSSISKALAHRLDADFLDTGAMYRAAAALALEAGVELDDGAAIAKLIRDAKLRFDFTTDPPTLVVAGAPMTDRLRDEDVSRAVSPVSALPEVRAELVQLQRAIGSERCRLVAEGRDQGSVVFPHANVKLYLDAAPSVRAARRARQLAALGRQAKVAQIEREIVERDARDMSRAVGPLIKPSDATVVDTSTLSFEEVVETLQRFVLQRLGANGESTS